MYSYSRDTSLLTLPYPASYPFLVHRLMVLFHASFPRSVALAQLHFLSLAVVSSREDFHFQDRTHAGRTRNLKNLSDISDFYSDFA
jgi:hypothetical protein